MNHVYWRVLCVNWIVCSTTGGLCMKWIMLNWRVLSVNGIVHKTWRVLCTMNHVHNLRVLRVNWIMLNNLRVLCVRWILCMITPGFWSEINAKILATSNSFNFAQPRSINICYTGTSVTIKLIMHCEDVITNSNEDW